MVSGRTTEARTIPALTKTAASTAVTGPAGTFSVEDAGRTVTGTGLAANTTIASVQSATAATLSVAATATNTNSAVLGEAVRTTTGYTGWSPESVAESQAYTVAAVNAGTVPPDKITDNLNPRPGQRSRG